MTISGIEKLTTIDFPGRVACVVFTPGCQFRCPYCYNPEFVIPEQIHRLKPSFIKPDVFFNFLENRKGLLDGVSITGGEPTIHQGLEDFIKKVKAMGFEVKLDTNGTNPKIVASLLEKKLLDYIAMDIKHVWDKYEKAIGVSNKSFIDSCKETFQLIQQSEIEHEFRTTLFPQEHTEEDIVNIAEQLQDGEQYFLQEIQYGNNLIENLDQTKLLNSKNLVETLKKCYPNLIINLRN